MNDLKKTRVDSTIAAVVPRLLNVLLPVNCVVCNTEGRYLCEGCEQDLPPLTRPYCYLRASPEVPQLCH